MKVEGKRWLRGPTLASGLVAGCMIVATVIAPVASADTTTGGESSKLASVNVPMTPEQIEWRDKKLAIIAQRLGAKAGQSAQSTKGAKAAVPMVPCEFDPPCEPGDPPPGTPFERVLDIRPRHQWRYYFCGPATVQVLSNYKWGYYVSNQEGGQTATANKYKQKFINSEWVEATPTGGVTNINNLIVGLNQSSGTPGFYSLWQGPSWNNFHNADVVDVHDSDVGGVAGVSPRKSGSVYFLSSWRNVTPGNYGHFIALTGYTNPDNLSSSRVWYHDSSGGHDQEDGKVILGSTGIFNDPSFTVYKTMMNRYGNLIW